MDKLKPIFNNVLAQRVDKGEKRTKSGLLIAGSPADNCAWRVKVIAVGPGVMQDGFFREVAPEIKPGVEVYVPAFAGYLTMIGTEEFVQCKDIEVLSVVETAEVGNNG